MKLLILTCVLGVSISSNVWPHERSNGATKSPESCVGKIDKLNEKTYRKARESGRAVDAQDLRRRRAEIADKCLGDLAIDKLAVEHLPALAKLYFEVNRQSEAFEVVTQYISKARAGSDDRAGVVLTAINYSLYSATAFEKAALAEKYLALLEHSGFPIRQRIDGHLRLVEHYISKGLDEKAVVHEIAIINLSKELSAVEQKSALDDTISTIDNQALVACSVQGAQRSRAIVEQLPPELVRLAHAEGWVEAILSRYLMEGQAAPELSPKFVLNAPNKEAGSGAKTGQVTVMLFAAHWCGPCHEIYPAVIDAQRRFQDQGVRVLLVTQLSDPTSDPKAPKPEEELAMVRRVYLDEMKMSFPILVEAPADRAPTGDANIDRQKANRQWKLFSFYPMILVIDKKARTRTILIGTLPGQGDRLRTKIEELLKETE
ncbi:MAG TPA: TlpA disulfide reductase family protein [Blastocatellia bacterium]|nr:TlpA disulfide reductase family protein [Blastocatellia bacterium]